MPTNTSSHRAARLLPTHALRRYYKTTFERWDRKQPKPCGQINVGTDCVSIVEVSLSVVTHSLTESRRNPTERLIVQFIAVRVSAHGVTPFKQDTPMQLCDNACSVLTRARFCHTHTPTYRKHYRRARLRLTNLFSRLRHCTSPLSSANVRSCSASASGPRTRRPTTRLVSPPQRDGCIFLCASRITHGASGRVTCAPSSLYLRLVSPLPLAPTVRHRVGVQGLIRSKASARIP
jgi:hypothetical protein